MEVAREYLQKAEDEMNTCICSEEKRKEIMRKNEENAGLQRVLELREEQVSNYERRLESREVQLEVAQQWLTNLRIDNAKNELLANVREDQLAITQTQLEETKDLVLMLQGTVNSLQTENSRIELEKERLKTERNERISADELKELTQNLFDRDEEIKKLEKELGQLKEENIRQKLQTKEEEFEEIIYGLRFGEDARKKARILLSVYEKGSSNVETIKDELSDAGVNINELKRIGRICEEIAELKTRLGTQQFQARIESPPRRFY
jgi:chromosome segregation ATPase